VQHRPRDTTSTARRVGEYRRYASDCGHGSHDYLPGVRLREGRAHADERLSERLRLRGLPVASKTALRRLLRVLLVCGSDLSPEADRRRLRLAEALTLGVKAGFLLGRDRRVKAPRDVPTKGAAQGAALADALGRTAATPTRRVVEPFDYRHGGSLRRGVLEAFPKPAWASMRARKRSLVTSSAGITWLDVEAHRGASVSGPLGELPRWGARLMPDRDPAVAEIVRMKMPRSGPLTSP
jgi:hypothetical protein